MPIAPAVLVPALIGAATSIGTTVAQIKNKPKPPTPGILDDGGPDDSGIGMQPPPLDLAPMQGVPSPEPMGGGGAPLLEAIQAPSM